MELTRCLTRSGHVHRFVVTSDVHGWEVIEEEDSAVLKRVHREDWHRVERDAWLFQVRACTLTREGWIDLSNQVPA